MSRPCGQRRALRVAAGTAGQDGFAAHPAGVDRAERGGGEGGEHARVRGDRSRGCLCRRTGPRGRAGGRRACRPAEQEGQTVSRRFPHAGQQHPAGLSRRVVDRGELAGRQVDGVDAALEPDGVGAAAGGGVLVFGGRGSRPSRSRVGCRRRMLSSPGPGASPGVRGTVAAVPMTGLPSVAGRPGGSLRAGCRSRPRSSRSRAAR